MKPAASSFLKYKTTTDVPKEPKLIVAVPDIQFTLLHKCNFRYFSKYLQLYPNVSQMGDPNGLFVILTGDQIGEVPQYRWRN